MGEEFKRQFILGNKIVKKDWNHVNVNGEYILSAQSELEVNQYRVNNKELTLVGYIINPHKPDKTNRECLKEIIENSHSTSSLLEELYIYSGRYVLISCINDEMFIAHDPCGLRQVYYTSIEGSMWFASQPNLLSSVFNIPKRKDEKVNNFINSLEYQVQESGWIGDDCIYENVFHLMPNHYFDFRKSRVRRYWVNREKDTTLNNAVEKASAILKGSMEAIANRGELVQGLSAGWDSRVLLAASKSVKDDIKYYVSLGNSRQKKNTDSIIASKLSTDLNLNLLVIDKLDDVREDVASFIKRDVTQGRNIRKTRTIQYFYDNFKGKINVNGNVSEIVRNFYGTNHPTIDNNYLFKLTNYEKIPFVKEHINNWMNEVPDSVLEDFELPDLLYWEQKMGNWGAMQKAEQDIALEDFTPFNNRQLIMTLYSVDKKYRKPDSYILYKKIMTNLWEGTLSQPINPKNVRDHILSLVKKVLSNDMKRKIKKILK